MTLEYRVGARIPEPFGSAPWGRNTRRIPGPLEFRQEDLSKSGATAAPKTLTMPAPTSGGSIMRARRIDWSLSGKKPAFQPSQSQQSVSWVEGA